MFTQKAAIDLVKKFAQQISDSGIRLKGVILFGSYSRNEQHKWSDIDVALIADEFIGAGFYDIDLYGKTLIKKQFQDISPRTYRTRDFNPEKDPFVEEILKTGIVIV